jgi:hypothetical protein
MFADPATENLIVDLYPETIRLPFCPSSITSYDTSSFAKDVTCQALSVVEIQDPSMAYTLPVLIKFTAFYDLRFEHRHHHPAPER